MNIRISDEVVFRDLAGEAVLLDLASGTYFGLNAVGTRIWHLIADHGSTDGIIEALLAEYEVEETLLRKEVDALIQQLIEKGLLRANDKETPPAC